MASNCGGVACSPAVDRARFRQWRGPGSREEVSGSLLASRRGLCVAPVGLGGSRATRPRRRGALFRHGGAARGWLGCGGGCGGEDRVPGGAAV